MLFSHPDSVRAEIAYRQERIANSFRHAADSRRERRQRRVRRHLRHQHGG